MSLINRLYNHIFGEDKETRFGVGWFTWDDFDNEDWMRCHDFATTSGSHTQQTMERLELDWELFWSFAEKRIKERNIEGLMKLLTYQYGLTQLGLDYPQWEGEKQ